MTFFLITTDHLETCLWFRDDEDFKAGMNHVASVAFCIGVHVLAFILMSNHVHFVLECTEEEALRFITEFKRIHSWYLRRKYGAKELLRENDVDIQELVLGNESLERAIAYVQMNCVAANICLHPTEYPWGTGRAFFQVGRADGTALGNLSGRARNRILHSRMNLPSGWLVGPDGFILPESYVNVRFVENLYRSPGRMNYFLTNSSKAKRTLARQEAELASFRDQVLLAALPDLCRSLFREKSPGQLNPDQMKTLAGQLRRRFSADPHQISRVTGIPYAELTKMLQDF